MGVTRMTGGTVGIEHPSKDAGRTTTVRQAAESMRAVVQRHYGPPSALEPAELGIPTPGRGEVLVRVGAVSLHPGDHFVMIGRPYVLRLVFGLRRPRRGIPGTDLAGVVAAVGKDVTALRPGDEVFGWTGTGALAEYAVVPADHLVPVPDGLSVTEAAAVPTSGMTALAVQIAKSLGAEVTGVCSTGNVELVRSLGADHVVDYTSTDFTSGDGRYDVILDNVERHPLVDVRRVLTPTGTMIPNSGHGGRWIGPLGRILRARMLSGFPRQRLKPFTSLGKRDDLLVLADLLATGRITPAIDRAYPLDEAAEALRHVASGHARGKVVVVI